MSKIEFKKNLCLNCGHIFYNALGKRRGRKITTYHGCNVRDFKSKNCSSRCSTNWWHKNGIYKRLVSKALEDYNENRTTNNERVHKS